MAKKGTGFLLLGAALILAAGFLAAANGNENSQAGQASREIVHTLLDALPVLAPEPDTGYTQDLPAPGESSPDPRQEMPVKNLDGQDYIGILRIPTLELELPIMYDWSYPQLKIAPCRYAGSAYQDNLILCAHNYTSHFGRLRQLHMGDEVSFTDVDGNLFVYQVLELEILQPSDRDYLLQGDWDLTLFTCTVGGQTRVTVRCQRIS